MTITEYRMLVGGAWTRGKATESLPCNNPYDQSIWGKIPQATPEDVDSAVNAARRAFQTSWRSLKPWARSKILLNIADALEDNSDRLSQVETRGNGKVIRETKKQVLSSARAFRYFSGFCDKLDGAVRTLDNPDLFDYVLRQPIGVVGMIIPWNSPIALLTNKLAPALAAGCTAVIKPSEFASGSVLELAEILMKAGVPNGAINVVTGDSRVGGYLAEHSDIDKISFTGGGRGGRAVAIAAAKNVIPTTLELGGKSPNVIFADAHLEAAVPGLLAGIFGAAGQTCIAGSRALVHRSVYREVLERLASLTKKIVLGNPLEETTEMGPVANRSQFENILQMIEHAKDEGARLICGGSAVTRPPLDRGFFVEPTIFADVGVAAKLWQEEVFGPVLAVAPFDDEEECVAMANDSKFGLAAGIWTRDLSRAHRFARRIDAGMVWINTYRTSAIQAPFGGLKQSGYGRERGLEGILEFTVVKNVMIDLAESMTDPFSMRT